MKLTGLMKTSLNKPTANSKGKHLSNTIPVHNVLKNGDDLWPLLFNFLVENAHRNVQVNKEKLQLNGTCSFWYKLMIFSAQKHIYYEEENRSLICHL